MDKMSNLDGKVAFVAGGAGYLGLPVCRKLAEHGACVVVADIDKAKTKHAVEDVAIIGSGNKVKGLLFDVGDEQSIRGAIAETVEEFGGLDILINATYSAVGKLVEEVSADEFDATLHVNITSAFVLAREAARVMREGGSVIMFASMYGLVSPDPRIYVPPMKPNPIEYGVAKAAIVHMVKYLAVHWAPRNIRVNAIAPGAFPNPKVQKDHPDFIGRLAEKVPLGRIGRQDELADIIAFLASDKASYMTGQTLVVDGGWTVW